MAVHHLARLFVLMFSSFAQEVEDDINTFMTKVVQDGIVPDVIQRTPQAMLTFSFIKKDVTLGAAVTPEESFESPIDVRFPHTAGSYYTLLMLGPDVPSRSDPSLRSVLHWLVVNIKVGKAFDSDPVDYNTGTILMYYHGPQPTNGTGLHRVVVVAYKQDKMIYDAEKLIVPFNERYGFALSKFAAEQELGEPVALNYFVTSRESLSKGEALASHWWTLNCVIILHGIRLLT
ncbi:protein D3-like [Ornithodoros turicata]|uniref:protein D3-like n=1 Tax=Ornithodoros turicata TaxID=34597 RepID=UPI00313A3D46